jgi:hypothetical protein
MFVDSGDDSYIDVDLTDILSESDEEKLENESGSQDLNSFKIVLVSSYFILILINR